MTPNTYRSTSQCETRVDDQDYHLNHMKRKKIKVRLRILESLFGTFVLLIGTISSALCLWSFSGMDISHFPYAYALTIILGVQTLPWIIKSVTPCSYLTVTSALCILIGCISFASAVKLMKNNPKKVSPEKTAVSTASQTVTILPSPETTSPDKGIAALYKTQNP